MSSPASPRNLPPGASCEFCGPGVPASCEHDGRPICADCGNLYLDDEDLDDEDLDDAMQDASAERPWRRP